MPSSSPPCDLTRKYQCMRSIQVYSTVDYRGSVYSWWSNSKSVKTRSCTHPRRYWRGHHNSAPISLIQVYKHTEIHPSILSHLCSLLATIMELYTLCWPLFTMLCAARLIMDMHMCVINTHCRFFGGARLSYFYYAW